MLPRQPVFGAAADADRRAIEALLPGGGGVERMIVDPAAIDTGRFFRVRRENGDLWFLKVLRGQDYAGVAAADTLAARLPRRCGAVAPSAVLQFEDGSGRVAVVYPFIAARYAAAEPDDLSALGRAIAMLHEGLRESGDCRAIAERARARTERLLATLRRNDGARNLSEALAFGGMEPEAAGALESGRAQVLHGDLNPGNILFDLDRGAIRFLDFEDARHSHGAPLLDLALPLERLCLLQEDEATAVTLAALFLRAYADAAGFAPVERKGALEAALLFINRRALALMIERHEAGLETSPEEWRKFERLLRHHDARRDVIARIERASLA
jgi:Ser/Thr protein kinase RdoA (MazF antagonist)